MNDAVFREPELSEAVLNDTARQTLAGEFPAHVQKLFAMTSTNRDVARLYAAYHLVDNEVRRHAPGRQATCEALLAEALADRQFLKDQLHALLRDG